MSNIQTTTFSANGDSIEIPNVRQFTIYAGNENGSNFGGGTLTAQVKPEDTLGYSVAHEFTEAGVQTSVDYVGGCKLKLNLSGSTSPDLQVTVRWA